ncbi:MAG: hypothetical protein LBD13_03920, partial [Spirochaetaceae bacterium]|nr:hypothetical protein [Spirochaetaceae bacterium]
MQRRSRLRLRRAFCLPNGTFTGTLAADTGEEAAGAARDALGDSIGGALSLPVRGRTGRLVLLSLRFP